MIYAISDLHISLKGDKPMNIFGSSWDNYLQEIKADWLSKVSFDDIVLLCGDLSWAKDLDEAISDMSFFTSLPGRKIIIKGNHEYWWTSYSKVKLALPENVFAIQNNALSMENYVFCGTRGWDIPIEETTDDNKKIYNRELLRLEMSLKEATQIKKENQEIILMTHYPPYLEGYKPSAFTDIIEKYGVKKVVYGHIHSKKSPHKKYFILNGVEYFLTSCDIVDNQLIKISD